MATPKPTKNQLRRAKKKEEKKSQKAETVEKPKVEASSGDEKTESKDESAPVVEAAVKSETASADTSTPMQPLASIDYDDPAFSQFKDIFNKFGPDLEGDDVAREANAGNQGEVLMAEDGVPEEDQEGGPAKMSKKKRKKLNTLSIALLKASVSNPEVVEWHDVSSSDPRLLVVIKAQKNIVPVPGHWSLKREYLSSKRGIEKPAFRLPAFISETGITEMRDAVLEKQAEQTLKQKQRERVQPKMGKLDIDYQKLYDAFFRFQTKPSLTRFGDVYYEGKEWEAEFRNFKPGEISESLQEALNMPLGFPPPWLLQQQRVGPPPSYPNLKIPGLNAPLPPGASWGFQAGQWGKPPVDEYNRPLYGGDIFGVPGASETGGDVDAAQRTQGEPIERAIWGELQPPEEEEEEEEEEEDDEDEDEDDEGRGRDAADGLQTPSGLETPSGFVSSVPTDYPAGPLGVESSMAGELDLRKQRRGYETEDSVAGPRSAYTVIPERQAQAQGFFGSDRTYDLKGGRTAATTTGAAGAAAAGAPVLGQDDDAGRKRKKPGDVDVALDPDALLSHDGISKDELQRRFEEGRQDEGVGAQWKKQQYDDDLSEMIAQESRKRQKREEERRGGVAEKKKEAKYRF